jgi:hypothetical protein
VRSQFAAQVNRNLELLQMQVAAMGKAGTVVVHSAVGNDSVALRRRREAWYQLVSQRQQEASRLAESRRALNFIIIESKK